MPLPGVPGGGRLAAEGLGSPAGVVRALAGTGTAGGMTYWAKCGQIRALSGRSGERSQGRGTRETGRVLGAGQRVWREVSAGDGTAGLCAEQRAWDRSGTGWGVPGGEGEAGAASGSRGLPEEFLQRTRIGAWTRWLGAVRGPERDRRSLRDGYPRVVRSVEPWGTLVYRSYRTRLPISRRPLERAEGGGASRRGPRKEFPAQGQTATARGCSGGRDEDRVVGFFQPRGRASAGVTVPIFRKS